MGSGMISSDRLCHRPFRTAISNDIQADSREHWSLDVMQKAIHKEKPLPDIADVIDLRKTLEWLKSQGDLIETDKPVDPDLEVTGLQKHLDGGCPVIFNNVKGKPNHRVITNLFGDMNVINKMFGWKNDVERTRKIAQAFRKPLKPLIIPQDQAPAQEHVILDPDDVNKYMRSEEAGPWK